MAEGRLRATGSPAGDTDLRKVTQRLATSYSWAPFVLILVGYTGVQVHFHGTDVAEWDVLLLSAWATVAAGLAVAQTIPGRLHRTLVRLVDRGALDSSEARLGEVFATLCDRAATWGWVVGGVVAGAVGLAFLLAFPAGSPTASCSSDWP